MSLKYEQFGKFILLDKVAAGGMAEVYRAKAPGAEGIGKILAIKRILPQYNANSEFIDMFKSEANIAINLTQANIAQIYEFGEEKGLLYLLMEYIDGRNLRQVLSRCTKAQKALTIEQCVFVIAQISNGLDYAHRCMDKNTGGPLNIIHRDMSPQNIMISFEGEVKIIDFGIAKAESKIEHTKVGTLKGKFGYMSPEQAEGLELDSRTDIFSTGIVLWELLSGERLFVANNEVNTIRKIKECQIPSLRKINPNIHEELERITLKSLAKDRNLRYQTAAELYRDLSRFLYRVNPEFTQHDLGLMVKSLFKDDILEDRKKVMEYSKLKFNPKVKQKVDTNTNTLTETENSKILTTKTDIPKNLVHESKIPSPQSMDFSSMVDGVGIEMQRNANAQSHANNQNAVRSTQYVSTATRSTGFSQTSTGYGSSYKSKNARNSFLSHGLSILLILAGLGLGAFFVSKNSGSLGHLGSTALDTIQEIIFGKSSKETQASQMPPPKPAVALARVMVHSIPAGAVIELDGEQMGTTPAEITIPMNRQVSLALKRDGYIPYTKEIVATTSPDDFTATLQKAVVGYINIDVRPSTADIYVNGQKLSEKLPISRYPIPADKPIEIKAINPYANTSDQQTITIKQDTVKSITLFLRKSN